ncbi:BAF_collapsed_G0015010.mRNA.1.CDS.1 [Saccharomyces cerevisiae]|nr:BAF_collapsed_G0015010.mRNA.1.CDS.1 [Saccharomyces cerevisiae]
MGMGHVIHLIEDYQYESENIVTKDHKNKQQFSILKDILEIPLIMDVEVYRPSSIAIKEMEELEEEGEAVNWSNQQINVQSS